MANAYLIGYDLHKLGQRYSALGGIIERSYPVRWHCLDSTYIVKTEHTAAQVRDTLSAALDGNDVLLVIPVGRLWAARNLPQNCVDWLNTHL